MSQFNFPRVNFHGKAILDPATGNNSWYLPLVVFDGINVKAVMPPRVYLFDPYLVEGKTLEDVKAVLPEHVVIKEDLNLLIKDAFYIELDTIQDVTDFREWARTPLGEHEIDKDYHELYKLVNVPMNRTTLYGIIPGYWNLYGTMSFSYRDVMVTSIATGLSDSGENLVKTSNPSLSPLLSDILGAELTMSRDIHDKSTNAAVLVDLLPTMSLHTQIFTSCLSLFKNDQCFLRGAPLKASLRSLNAFRIVNENMPFGGSGVFYSAIPMENLDTELSGRLLELFAAYGNSGRKLKGVFFRQVVSEIEEERDFDYRFRGNVPNPATATLTGSLSPWYDDDMISWPGGRQLVGEAPFILDKPPEFQAPVSLLTPCSFAVHKKERLIQLDLLNNFPLVNTENETSLQSPSPYDENHYKTYDLGEVTFVLEAPKDQAAAYHSVSLETIHFSEEALSRKEMNDSGGMAFLKLPLSEDECDKVEHYNLAAYAKDSQGNTVRVWNESPTIIVSDQAAMYSNQGDDPIQGYRVFSAQKEPCQLRIFNRGVSQKTPIDISIMVFKMIVSGSTKIAEFYRTGKYKDGDHISFETNVPINALYFFMPLKTTKVPEHGYPSAILQTGFFVNHRVLPRHDYSRYFDASDPDYESEISFEVLYENVFRTFELLMPTMEFRKTRYTNPAMAKELVRRTSLALWNSPDFMPVSRDLSDDQILLIRKWASKYIELDFGADYDGLIAEDAHSEQLKGKHFFLK